MKKILITFILIISAFALAGCGGPTTYDEISYNEMKTKLNKKENFILFIGSETCHACASYKITLNKLIEKYHVDIKYIDISKLDEKQQSELQARFPFTGTPTTVFITKGEEKDTLNRIDGSEKYSKVLEKMIKNGYIKEA